MLTDTRKVTTRRAQRSTIFKLVVVTAILGVCVAGGGLQLPARQFAHFAHLAFAE